MKRDFAIGLFAAFTAIIISANIWAAFWMWATNGADLGVFLALFGVASIPVAMVFATLLHMSE